MNESDFDIVKRSKGSETRVLQNLRARRDSELEYYWSATGCRRIAIRYCQNPSLEQQMRVCLTKLVALFAPAEVDFAHSLH